MQPPAGPGMFVGFACAVVAALVLGLLIAAVLLRAAVGLYNRIAGGEHTEAGAPTPSLGWAMLIGLVNALANAGLNAATTFALAAALGATTQREIEEARGVAGLATLPLNLLVLSALLSVMLPTTFGRGLMIALFAYAIILVIAVLVGVAVAVVFLGLGMPLKV